MDPGGPVTPIACGPQLLKLDNPSLVNEELVLNTKKEKQVQNSLV